jgi:hypothetical protein
MMSNVKQFSKKLQHGGAQIAIMWLILAAISTSWAFATPLAASPDEPAHIIKAAAVSHGYISGEATSEAAVTEVQVPQSIAQAGAWPCFAFSADTSAGCIPETPGGTNLVSATTSAGLYNPSYYAMVGWASFFSEDGGSVVLMMRTISAIIVSLFLAIALRALVILCRPLIGGLIFLSFATPMVFFLNGVVNPNALEIATGVSFLSSLLLILTGKIEGSHRTLWLFSMSISGFLMANTRGISAFWLVCFVVLAMIAVGWKQFFSELKRKDFLLAAGVVAIGTALAGAWVLYSGTLTAMGTFPGAGEVSPLRAFFTMVIQRTADPGLIGVFGWLDTFAPPAVYFIWSVLIGGVLLLSLIANTQAQFVKALVSMAFFVFAPAVIQAASVQKSGFIWQGRYSLVMMAGMLIICGFLLSQNTNLKLKPKYAMKLVVTTSTLYVLGQAIAFVSVLGRYVTGNSGAIFAALGQGQWNPPLGSKLWFAINLVSVVALVATWMFITRMEQDQASKDLPEYPVAVR